LAKANLGARAGEYARTQMLFADLGSTSDKKKRHGVCFSKLRRCNEIKGVLLMIKILFVCHGNICRSPMAEFVMKKLVSDAGLEHDFEIASAATSTEEIGNPIHPGTKQALANHGVAYERRKARQITQGDYDTFDYLVGMDKRNIINMKRAWHGDPGSKVSMLLDWTHDYRDVADPWYTGDFETTYNDVLAGCQALLSESSITSMAYEIAK
jgi:protein-tyrosine phosphatase